MTASDPRSHLPHFLAAMYALAVVYASLQPFGPWIAPPPGTPFFVFAPWPRHITRFDVLANVAAYLPFGFLVALAPASQRPWQRWLLAAVLGTALSFAMETLQAYLPTRDAGMLDVLANGGGAAMGGVLGNMSARAPAVQDVVTRARLRWFLPGKLGDLGLALLALWLAVQVNPAIPLFATMYEPAPSVAATGVLPSTERDVAGVLVEAAHSGFQLLGVGLFLALLLRSRSAVGGAVLLLLGAAVMIKGVAAHLLLKPAAFERWLTPGVSTGVAAGALALLVAIGLPRAVQIALATVALLSSLLATLLAPGLIVASAPLGMFNWSYGHLLNFNGLTHAVLVAWPLAASALLFALAGRPRWGAPEGPGEGGL